MTYAGLLRAHEVARRRAVDRLSVKAVARISGAFESFDHAARAMWTRVPPERWRATLTSLYALHLGPVVAELEASLVTELADLEELGVSQAEAEAEALDAEPGATVPVVVGAGAVVLSTLALAVSLAARDAVAANASGTPFEPALVLAALRREVRLTVELTITTEATRSLSAGALASIRTFTGVDAVWRTESDPCPICANLAGSLIDVGTGIPPAHPLCRCTTVPWPAAESVPASVGAA